MMDAVGRFYSIVLLTILACSTLSGGIHVIQGDLLSVSGSSRLVDPFGTVRNITHHEAFVESFGAEESRAYVRGEQSFWSERYSNDVEAYFSMYIEQHLNATVDFFEHQEVLVEYSSSLGFEILEPNLPDDLIQSMDNYLLQDRPSDLEPIEYFRTRQKVAQDKFLEMFDTSEGFIDGCYDFKANLFDYYVVLSLYSDLSPFFGLGSAIDSFARFVHDSCYGFPEAATSLYAQAETMRSEVFHDAQAIHNDSAAIAESLDLASADLLLVVDALALSRNAADGVFGVGCENVFDQALDSAVNDLKERAVNTSVAVAEFSGLEDEWLLRKDSLPAALETYNYTMSAFDDLFNFTLNATVLLAETGDAMSSVQEAWVTAKQVCPGPEDLLYGTPGELSALSQALEELTGSLNATRELSVWSTVETLSAVHDQVFSELDGVTSLFDVSILACENFLQLIQTPLSGDTTSQLTSAHADIRQLLSEAEAEDVLSVMAQQEIVVGGLLGKAAALDAQLDEVGLFRVGGAAMQARRRGAELMHVLSLFGGRWQSECVTPAPQRLKQFTDATEYFVSGAGDIDDSADRAAAFSSNVREWLTSERTTSFLADESGALFLHLESMKDLATFASDDVTVVDDHIAGDLASMMQKLERVSRDGDMLAEVAYEAIYFKNVTEVFNAVTLGLGEDPELETRLGDFAASVEPVLAAVSDGDLDSLLLSLGGLAAQASEAIQRLSTQRHLLELFVGALEDCARLLTQAVGVHADTSQAGGILQEAAEVSSSPLGVRVTTLHTELLAARTATTNIKIKFAESRGNMTAVAGASGLISDLFVASEVAYLAVNAVTDDPDQVCIDGAFCLRSFAYAAVHNLVQSFSDRGLLVLDQAAATLGMFNSSWYGDELSSPLHTTYLSPLNETERFVDTFAEIYTYQESANTTSLQGLALAESVFGEALRRGSAYAAARGVTEDARARVALLNQGIVPVVTELAGVTAAVDDLGASLSDEASLSFLVDEIEYIHGMETAFENASRLLQASRKVRDSEAETDDYVENFMRPYSQSGGDFQIDIQNQVDFRNSLYTISRNEMRGDLALPPESQQPSHCEGTATCLHTYSTRTAEYTDSMFVQKYASFDKYVTGDRNFTLPGQLDFYVCGGSVRLPWSPADAGEDWMLLSYHATGPVEGDSNVFVIIGAESHSVVTVLSLRRPDGTYLSADSSGVALVGSTLWLAEHVSTGGATGFLVSFDYGAVLATLASGSFSTYVTIFATSYLSLPVNPGALFFDDRAFLPGTVSPVADAENGVLWISELYIPTEPSASVSPAHVHNLPEEATPAKGGWTIGLRVLDGSGNIVVSNATLVNEGILLGAAVRGFAFINVPLSAIDLQTSNTSGSDDETARIAVVAACPHMSGQLGCRLEMHAPPSAPEAQTVSAVVEDVAVGGGLPGESTAVEMTMLFHRRRESLRRAFYIPDGAFGLNVFRPPDFNASSILDDGISLAVPFCGGNSIFRDSLPSIGSEPEDRLLFFSLPLMARRNGRQLHNSLRVRFPNQEPLDSTLLPELTFSFDEDTDTQGSEGVSFELSHQERNLELYNKDRTWMHYPINMTTPTTLVADISLSVSASASTIAHEGRVAYSFSSGFKGHAYKSLRSETETAGVVWDSEFADVDIGGTVEASGPGNRVLAGASSVDMTAQKERIYGAAHAAQRHCFDCFSFGVQDMNCSTYFCPEREYMLANFSRPARAGLALISAERSSAEAQAVCTTGRVSIRPVDKKYSLLEFDGWDLDYGTAHTFRVSELWYTFRVPAGFSGDNSELLFENSSWSVSNADTGKGVLRLLLRADVPDAMRSPSDEGTASFTTSVVVGVSVSPIARSADGAEVALCSRTTSREGEGAGSPLFMRRRATLTPYQEADTGLLRFSPSLLTGSQSVVGGIAGIQDLDSVGVVDVSWAAGSQPGATDVVGWRTVGLKDRIHYHVPSGLLHGAGVYVAFRVVDSLKRATLYEQTLASYYLDKHPTASSAAVVEPTCPLADSCQSFSGNTATPFFVQSGSSVLCVAGRGLTDSLGGSYRQISVSFGTSAGLADVVPATAVDRGVFQTTFPVTTQGELVSDGGWDHSIDVCVQVPLENRPLASGVPYYATMTLVSYGEGTLVVHSTAPVFVDTAGPRWTYAAVGAAPLGARSLLSNTTAVPSLRHAASAAELALTLAVEVAGLERAVAAVCRVDARAACGLGVGDAQTAVAFSLYAASAEDSSELDDVSDENWMVLEPQAAAVAAGLQEVYALTASDASQLDARLAPGKEYRLYVRATALGHRAVASVGSLVLDASAPLTGHVAILSPADAFGVLAVELHGFRPVHAPIQRFSLGYGYLNEPLLSGQSVDASQVVSWYDLGAFSEVTSVNATRLDLLGANLEIPEAGGDLLYYFVCARVWSRGGASAVECGVPVIRDLRAPSRTEPAANSVFATDAYISSAVAVSASFVPLSLRPGGIHRVCFASYAVGSVCDISPPVELAYSPQEGEENIPVSETFYAAMRAGQTVFAVLSGQSEVGLVSPSFVSAGFVVDTAAPTIMGLKDCGSTTCVSLGEEERPSAVVVTANSTLGESLPVCFAWQVVLPRSGIAEMTLAVGQATGASDVVAPTSIESTMHQQGSVCVSVPARFLAHGAGFYATLSVTAGSGAAAASVSQGTFYDDVAHPCPEANVAAGVRYTMSGFYEPLATDRQDVLFSPPARAFGLSLTPEGVYPAQAGKVRYFQSTTPIAVDGARLEGNSLVDTSAIVKPVTTGYVDEGSVRHPTYTASFFHTLATLGSARTCTTEAGRVVVDYTPVSMGLAPRLAGAGVFAATASASAAGLRIVYGPLVDPESGVDSVWIGAGSSAGLDNLVPFALVDKQDTSSPLAAAWESDVYGDFAVGSSYYVAVKAVNGAGVSSVSVSQKITTDVSHPDVSNLELLDPLLENEATGLVMAVNASAPSGIAALEICMSSLESFVPRDVEQEDASGGFKTCHYHDLGCDYRSGCTAVDQSSEAVDVTALGIHGGEPYVARFTLLSGAGLRGQPLHAVLRLRPAPVVSAVTFGHTQVATAQVPYFRGLSSGAAGACVAWTLDASFVDHVVLSWGLSEEAERFAANKTYANTSRHACLAGSDFLVNPTHLNVIRAHLYVVDRAGDIEGPFVSAGITYDVSLPYSNPSDDPPSVGVVARDNPHVSGFLSVPTITGAFFGFYHKTSGMGECTIAAVSAESDLVLYSAPQTQAAVDGSGLFAVTPALACNGCGMRIRVVCDSARGVESAPAYSDVFVVDPDVPPQPPTAELVSVIDAQASAGRYLYRDRQMFSVKVGGSTGQAHEMCLSSGASAAGTCDLVQWTAAVSAFCNATVTCTALLMLSKEDLIAEEHVFSSAMRVDVRSVSAAGTVSAAAASTSAFSLVPASGKLSSAAGSGAATDWNGDESTPADISWQTSRTSVGVRYAFSCSQAALDFVNATGGPVACISSAALAIVPQFGVLSDAILSIPDLPIVETGSIYDASVAPFVCFGDSYYAVVTVEDALGDTFMFSSSGFRCDISPPSSGVVTVAGGATKIVFNVGEEEEIAKYYTSRLDAMDIVWRGFLDPGAGVDYYRYAVGTAVNSRVDILPFTQTSNLHGISLAGLALASGSSYIVTVVAHNTLGVVSGYPFAEVFVDSSAPVAGAVSISPSGCHSDTLPSLVAVWDAFAEAESLVTAYSVELLNDGGEAVRFGTQLETSVTVALSPDAPVEPSYSLQLGPTLLACGQTYRIAVTAVNAVDLTTTAVSSSFYHTGCESPTAGSVSIGLPSQITNGTWNTRGHLNASWTGFAASHANCPISEYLYALGTRYGEYNTLGLVSNGLSTSLDMLPLFLSENMAYELSVAAVSESGKRSAVAGVPFIVDYSAPDLSTLRLRVSGSEWHCMSRDGDDSDICYWADTDSLSVAWDRIDDDESGVSQCEMSLVEEDSGNSVVGAFAVEPASGVNNMDLTGSPLAAGTAYVCTMACGNTAGLEASSSIVVVVDTAPPPAFAVRGGVRASLEGESFQASSSSLIASFGADVYSAGVSPVRAASCEFFDASSEARLAFRQQPAPVAASGPNCVLPLSEDIQEALSAFYVEVTVTTAANLSRTERSSDITFGNFDLQSSALKFASYSSSLSRLDLQWEAAGAAVGSIIGYEVAFGTALYSDNVVPFTPVEAAARDHSVSDLSLQSLGAYYATLVAVHESGQTIAMSAGPCIVDPDPPEYTPVATYVSPILVLNAGWSEAESAYMQSGTDHIDLRYGRFTDAGSGVESLSIKLVEAADTSVVGFSDTNMTFSSDVIVLDGLTVSTGHESVYSSAALDLVHGTLYYVIICAHNGAGMESCVNSTLSIDALLPAGGYVKDLYGSSDGGAAWDSEVDVDYSNSLEYVACEFGGFYDEEIEIAQYEIALVLSCAWTSEEGFPGEHLCWELIDAVKAEGGVWFGGPLARPSVRMSASGCESLDDGTHKCVFREKFDSLLGGRRYFFAVRAFNRAGTASGFVFSDGFYTPEFGPFPGALDVINSTYVEDTILGARAYLLSRETVSIAWDEDVFSPIPHPALEKSRSVVPGVFGPHGSPIRHFEYAISSSLEHDGDVLGATQITVAYDNSTWMRQPATFGFMGTHTMPLGDEADIRGLDVRTCVLEEFGVVVVGSIDTVHIYELERNELVETIVLGSSGHQAITRCSDTQVATVHGTGLGAGIARIYDIVRTLDPATQRYVYAADLLNQFDVKQKTGFPNPRDFAFSSTGILVAAGYQEVAMYYYYAQQNTIKRGTDTSYGSSVDIARSADGTHFIAVGSPEAGLTYILKERGEWILGVRTYSYQTFQVVNDPLAEDYNYGGGSWRNNFGIKVSMSSHALCVGTSDYVNAVGLATVYTRADDMSDFLPTARLEMARVRQTYASVYGTRFGIESAVYTFSESQSFVAVASSGGNGVALMVVNHGRQVADAVLEFGIVMPGKPLDSGFQIGSVSMGFETVVLGVHSQNSGVQGQILTRALCVPGRSVRPHPHIAGAYWCGDCPAGETARGGAGSVCFDPLTSPSNLLGAFERSRATYELEVSGFVLQDNVPVYLSLTAVPETGTTTTVSSPALYVDTTRPHMASVFPGQDYTDPYHGAYLAKEACIPFMWRASMLSTSVPLNYKACLSTYDPLVPVHTAEDDVEPYEPACDTVAWTPVGTSDPVSNNQHEFCSAGILQGRPGYVVSVRATNPAGVSSTRDSNPVILDTSPPQQGVILDGVDNADIDGSIYADRSFVHWKAFPEPESEIAYYEVGLASATFESGALTEPDLVPWTRLELSDVVREEAEWAEFNSSHWFAFDGLSMTDDDWVIPWIKATNKAQITSETYSSDGAIVGRFQLNIDANVSGTIFPSLADQSIYDSGSGSSYYQGRDTHMAIQVPLGLVAPEEVISLETYVDRENANIVAPADYKSANFSFYVNAVNPLTKEHIDGFKFSNPLSLSFNYDIHGRANVDNIMDQPILMFFNTSSNTWEDASLSCGAQHYERYDQVELTYDVNVCHLTRFALFFRPSYYSVTQVLPFIEQTCQAQEPPLVVSTHPAEVNITYREDLVKMGDWEKTECSYYYDRFWTARSESNWYIYRYQRSHIYDTESPELTVSQVYSENVTAFSADPSVFINTTYEVDAGTGDVVERIVSNFCLHNASVVPAPSSAVTDNCDPASVLLVAETAQQPSGPLSLCPMNLTRTYTVTDRCGNAHKHTQHFRIFDVVDPVWTLVPEDYKGFCTDRIPHIRDVSIAAWDNSGVVDIQHSETRKGLCPSYIERSWTATDVTGNRISYTQYMTLERPDWQLRYGLYLAGGVAALLVSYWCCMRVSRRFKSYRVERVGKRGIIQVIENPASPLKQMWVEDHLASDEADALESLHSKLSQKTIMPFSPRVEGALPVKETPRSVEGPRIASHVARDRTPRVIPQRWQAPNPEYLKTTGIGAFKLGRKRRSKLATREYSIHDRTGPGRSLLATASTYSAARPKKSRWDIIRRAANLNQEELEGEIDAIDRGRDMAAAEAEKDTRPLHEKAPYIMLGGYTTRQAATTPELRRNVASGQLMIDQEVARERAATERGFGDTGSVRHSVRSGHYAESAWDVM